MRFKYLLPFLLLAFATYSTTLRASHVLGGQMSYVLLDSASNLYEIQLWIYRDCSNGEAPLDQIVDIFIYEKGAVNFQREEMNPPELLPPFSSQLNGCLADSLDFCVEAAVYKKQVTLNPSALGYDIGWARCCLANSISNLAMPLSEGLTFTVSVPPTNVGLNSSPLPLFSPPSALCGNYPFEVDFSSIDADGDSLVYTLVTPLGGLDTLGRGVGNPSMGGNMPISSRTNPLPPPPYIPVAFAPSYNAAAPFGTGQLQLDSQTGMLTGDSITTGSYTFAIEVQEYRDGVFLGKFQKTFTLGFVECQGAALSSQLLLPRPDTLINGIITIYAEIGDSLCFDMIVSSPDSLDTISLMTGNDTTQLSYSDTSGISPLTSTICWQGSPDDIQGTCHFIEIEASSSIHCPGTPNIKEIFKICINSGDALSIAENNVLTDHISLYPNPGSDFLTIEIEPTLSMHIQAYDMNGGLVFQSDMVQGNRFLNIETVSWPKGMYVFVLESNGKYGTKKWLKK